MSRPHQEGNVAASYSINAGGTEDGTDDNSTELEHLVGSETDGSSCCNGSEFSLPCGIRSALSCRIRRRLPMGKSLAVVLALNTLESFVFFQGVHGMFATAFRGDLTHIQQLVPLLFQMITNSAGRLVYPFAGFIADAFLGRSRVVHLSMLLLWIALSVMWAGLVSKTKIGDFYYVLQGIAFASFSFGSGSFEANVIPFGADQLQGVSSEEISAYFYWYYWTRQMGNVLGIVSICLVQLLEPSLREPMVPLVGIAAITLGIMIYNVFSKSLLSAGPPSNPLKLVVSVTLFAATLKRRPPVHRRAFRYGEEKKGRMELAKKDFDGIFESEEVEDVKTFYRILMMFLPMGVFYIAYYGVRISLIVHINAGLYACMHTGLFQLVLTITYEASLLFAQLYQPQDATMKYIAQNLFNLLDPIVLLIIIPLINFVAPCFLCYFSISLRFRVGVGYFVILLAAISLVMIESIPAITESDHLVWLLLPSMLVIVAEVLSVVSGNGFPLV